jgi:hypothetical protein
MRESKQKLNGKGKSTFRKQEHE